MLDKCDFIMLHDWAVAFYWGFIDAVYKLPLLLLLI